jgi:hypothetical protein
MDQLFALGNVPDTRELINLLRQQRSPLGGEPQSFATHPWFETRGLAALLTMRNNLVAS